MPYAATPDPYCYLGSTVLKNLADLRSQESLDEFEHLSVTQRAEEPFPDGRLGVAHYKAVHRHLFQDVYAWAGRYRSIRIAKGTSMFCYPENIAEQMKALFSDLKAKRHLRGVDADAFAHELSSFLSTINAIHPFREGNGRTQMAFAALLAHRAGHPLALDRLEPQKFLAAMIASFAGSERQLKRIILQLM